MYIQHLKKQLAMRDQIIKDKLGASATNFLKSEMMSGEDNETYDNDIFLP